MALERKSQFSAEKVMVALFFLAIFLRLPTLGSVLFHGDEATTFLMHFGSSWKSLFLSYLGPNQHTLFSVLSNFVIKMFGVSEITFRLTSVIAGSLAAPLTFLVGKRLTGSKTVGWISGILMAFSASNIFWSQLGRGYALTICLSLAVVFFALKIEDDLPDWSWRWRCGLILSGLAIVLTLPSNVYFLLGCAVAFLICFNTAANKSTTYLKDKSKTFVPWAILFLLVGIYFLLNLPDLQRGVKIYREYARLLEGQTNLAFTLERIMQIFANLISPWGLWVYLLFFIGWGALKRDRILQLFFILTIPIVFAWSAEILGPPRSYVFWSPFILILMANGILTLVRVLSGWPALLHLKKPAVALVVAGLLWSPINNLIDYYPSRLGKTFSSIDEAKRVSEYISKKTTPHQMVVFPFDDRVLRFFIEEQVAKKMARIFTEENLDGLLFIGHKNIPPKNIPLVGLVKASPLSNDSFALMHEIGDLRIYKLDVQTVPLFATGSAPDVRSRFPLEKYSSLGATTMPSPWTEDREMLVIQKKGETDFIFRSPQSKFLESEGKQGYLLSVFGRKLDQESIAGILRSGEGKEKSMIFLNYLSGISQKKEGLLDWFPVHPYYHFRPAPDNLESFWRIEFSIMALNNGEQQVREALSLKDTVSYFDGFHTYLLYPES
jgi:4-amino-4-deoxy-L-arabinose transferase-like glycosyltransferase